MAAAAILTLVYRVKVALTLAAATLIKFAVVLAVNLMKFAQAAFAA